jgi:hypothetical protein
MGVSHNFPELIMPRVSYTAILFLTKVLTILNLTRLGGHPIPEIINMKREVKTKDQTSMP